jgi:hypothetical protein
MVCNILKYLVAVLAPHGLQVFLKSNAIFFYLLPKPDYKYKDKSMNMPIGTAGTVLGYRVCGSAVQIQNQKGKITHKKE